MLLMLRDIAAVLILTLTVLVIAAWLASLLMTC